MIKSNFKKLNFHFIINILIAFLPLSFIAGNSIINLNLILIILTCITYWKSNFFKIKLFLIDKLLIFFFLFSIISGLINFFYFIENDASIAKENFIKSIVYTRYLLFYFSLRLIVENKYFNFKFFFLFSGISVVFVSLDLILQFYSGTDIFGFAKSQYRVSGPFGNELIAGSYLQRFSLFLFFVFIFFKDVLRKNTLILILSILFVLIFFSVTIAGNRMPLVLFVLSFIILFSFEKKLRKFFLILIPIISIVFFALYIFHPYIKDLTDHFLRLSVEIITSFDQIYDPKLNFTNMYLKEFNLGYMTWKENLIIGGGINSFYLNCKINFDICTNHPHNYYLEILSELGIIGFITFLMIVIKLFVLFFRVRKYLADDLNKNLITPFALLFFVEIFPIKTTGSFFTTGNASYIFFLIAVMIGLINKTFYLKKN